ncbi:MAG: hypothetical protein AAFX99_27985, partial [Myxococcota bacterium]
MHSKPALLLLTTVATLLALCTPTYAQEGAETHDGFMVRLGIGFGVSSATFQESGLPDLELEASASNAGHINVALGYAVIDNLIVHADLFGGFLAEPTVTRGDTELGDLDGTQLNLYGFGLGLTYYIMPLNLYVAGSFGAARVVFDLDGEAYELDDASGTAL